MAQKTSKKIRKTRKSALPIPNENELIEKIKELPHFFEGYLVEQGQVFDDADLIKAVKLIDGGLDLWTFFCAIINFQCPITKVLIPMLSALAGAIRIYYNRDFLSFLNETQTRQIEILSTFRWIYTNVKGEGIKKIGWSMHRLIQIPQIICIFTKLKNLNSKYKSFKTRIKSLWNTAATDEFKSFLEEFIKTFYELDFCDGCEKCPNTDEKYAMTMKIFSGRHIKACAKRYLLFLRWIARDLQLWQFIPINILRIVIDTHTHRVCNRLGILDGSKNCKWKHVEDLTNFLRKIHPEDPTEYDLPLMLMGVLEICVKDLKKCRCSECPLSDVCHTCASSDLKLS